MARQKVYQCENWEHYYDDFVNVCICNSRENPEQRCKVLPYCRDLCPYFKKSSLPCETVDLDEREEKLREDFRKEVADRIAKAKNDEYREYLRLKAKYEN